MTVPERIEKHFQSEEWSKARTLLFAELDKDPEDHWLLTRLSTTYYEEKDYTTALELSEGAMELAPDCPLVQWDYASTLDMVGKPRKAIGIWKSLLRKKVATLAFSECGEGIRWAKSLLNDCRYRIAKALIELGEIRNAERYIRAHLDSRMRGLPSLYSMRDARNLLNRILAQIINLDK